MEARCKDYIKLLNEDIHILIATYLDARSLCRWTQTCRHLQSYELVYTEPAWKILCEKRRYRFNGNLRNMGATTYKLAYQFMSSRQMPPRSKFTEKRHRVFGDGKAAGVMTWIYLEHSTDCKPRFRRYHGQPKNVVTMKICIQNTGVDCVLLQITDSDKTKRDKALTSSFDMNFLTVHLRENEELPTRKAMVFNHQLKAFNGNDVQDDIFFHHAEGISRFKSNEATPLVAPDSIKLSYLDSLVFTFDVECDEIVENEVDFLCTIDNIKVHYESIQSVPPYHRLKQTIDCRIYDEDIIWENYLALPRGLVVLREDVKNETL